MKSMLVALLALSMPLVAVASPIGKVLEMLSELEAKIIDEGAAAQKIYADFTEKCEEDSAQLQFEIKTGKANVAELSAAIQEATGNIDAATAKIEAITGKVSAAEADLKAATEIRAKENAEFVAKEKELVEVIDTLSRAVTIIEREMQGGASMLQLQNAQSVVEALKVMVSASSISVADASQLTALVQSSDSDEDAGAPDAAVYKSHSGGIVSTLEDLKGKAEEQLEEARSEETKSQHAFELMEQSLTDEIKYLNADKAKTTTKLNENEQAKATAEGDLAVTKKDLAQAVKNLADLHHLCMSTSETFEAETKSRGEELKALDTAEKITKEATSFAQTSYSFMQVSTASSDAVRLVRNLAMKQHNPALAQLASRISSIMHSEGGSRDDIFSKVKGLIRDMIETLNKEAEADATEKAYCDKELAETNQKKADHEAEIAKLTTSIDSMSARSAKLKEEVATLQQELAALAKSQAEMDKIRAEEKAAFDTNKAELEKGLAGLKAALKVLRDYYAKEDKGHAAAEGAGGSIIGLLEVCESDFATGLSQAIADEEQAVNEYEATTKENEITKATKEQDVKYKTQESKGLDKETAEATSDREGVQSELDAVNEYLGKLEERCIAKAEPYAERKARREAEIAGLKEALDILSNDAALVQTSTRKHTLRGAQLRTE